jgi:hypothetical protein
MQIDTTYLNNLQSQLQTLLTAVEGQLRGIGTTSSPQTSGFLNTVDQTLTVQAGATTFNAGAALNTALKNMGGSVHDQLTWLQRVLTDMISEITTTVQSFSGTESLNNDTVEQLITDFQSTISDMSNGPGNTSSSNSSSNTPPTTSTSNPNTSSSNTPTTTS